MEHWSKLDVNKDGHLMLGGCDALELAKEFGTPLYVMEEDVIRGVCREYMRTVKTYKGGAKVLYAGKAFMTTAICRIVESEGLGLDVVSEGEIRTAMNAGFDMSKAYLHGNNKTPRDLNIALESGVGRIVIDSFAEIKLLSRIAKEHGKVQDVSVRIKPGIEAHTHDYIKTGQVDSKFGFGAADGQGMEAVKEILAEPSLNLTGLHCHIGSQIFELQPYRDAVNVMLSFLKSVRDETGFLLNEINFGGGYGIHYLKEDKPYKPSEYIEAMIEELNRVCAEKDIPLPAFVIEPGRSIVGEAGTTLYTVGDIKHIPNIRTYVSVDGGMADNPRPALYQAKYTCALAGKMNKPDSTVVSIAGRTCESGDMLIWNATLPEAEAGDIMAVFSTGAYNYSMASNYNMLPHPAVVLVKNGKAELMTARQTYEDLIKNDRIPSWL
ncbi:MAG: diaminopimelate decarboxylase [Burkholderiales bacterium]